MSLQKKIMEEDYTFFLQPKVDLKTGEIVGAEALARGVRSDGSFVMPADFIEEMEENSSILKLDFMIYEKVCAMMRERLDKNLPVVHTSVNLSRRHIVFEDTADRLFAISKKYDISPKYLEIEITERIFLKELEPVAKLINKLHAYGYSISIDDFGSGYSGFNTFRDLQFDVLKLDKTLLDEDEEIRAKNEALFPNIIDACHKVNTHVICEGVETKEQCQYLLRMGCTEAQGFYFSKPIPSEDFYEQYEHLNGKYPLSMIEDTDAVVAKGPMGRGRQEKENFIDRHLYAMIAIFMAVVVGLATLVVFRYYSKGVNREFGDMLIENLDSYGLGQKEQILFQLHNLVDTLEAVSVLEEESAEDHLLHTYINELNNQNSNITYSYATAEEMEIFRKTNILDEERQWSYDQLKSGAYIISDVWQRVSGEYVVACMVPIMRNKTFVGALIGYLDAKILTDVSYFERSDVNVLWSILTDGHGKLIPVQESDERIDSSLNDYLKQQNISEELINQIQNKSLFHQVATVPVGFRDGEPTYVSKINMRYNDWHLIVGVQVQGTSPYSDNIVRITRIGAVFQGIIVAFVGITLFLLALWFKKKHEENRRRYALVEYFSDTVIFEYDCKNDTIYFTPNVHELIQVTGEIQEKFLYSINSHRVFGGDTQLVAQLLRGEITNRQEIRVRLLNAKTEQYGWYLIKFQYVRDSKDRLQTVIGKISDIDIQKRQEEYLLKLSQMDKLTNLENKASAESRINRYLEENCKGSFFMIDIDDFKKINDQSGHITGDATLQYVGECIREIFRGNDVMGRIGGDEFIVFSRKMENKETAIRKAEALLNLFEQAGDKDVASFSASIGVAITPKEKISYKELFNRADKAMYQAKKKGKGCACILEE